VKIFSYVMSFGDEADTLADALSSLAFFSDHIYVTDGVFGSGTLCHHPRYLIPLSDWFQSRPEYRPDSWNGVPLTLWVNEFKDPAGQRNWTMEAIRREPERPDWITWIDSDEVCSWEMIRGIRDHLRALPSNTAGVYTQWLNLVQDEQHCVGGHHSSWLAHPRIHKLDNVYFSGNWHEHMVIDRANLDRWDVRIVHTRPFYRKRLLVQRGHPTIRHRSQIEPGKSPFWDDAQIEPIPAGVTWPVLHYPEDEIVPFPIDRDALEVWNELGNSRNAGS
jgi:hypothetical protein